LREKGREREHCARLMMVLEQHRLVVKNRRYRALSLGAEALRVGIPERSMDSTSGGAHGRILDRLQDEFGETVFFCILDEGQVFYVEKVESQRQRTHGLQQWGAALRHIAQQSEGHAAELPER